MGERTNKNYMISRTGYSLQQPLPSMLGRGNIYYHHSLPHADYVTDHFFCLFTFDLTCIHVEGKEN